VGFAVFLIGYSLTGIERINERNISIRYDLAWGASHSLMLILLGFAVNNRTGCCHPLLLAMAAMLPLSLAWTGLVFQRVRACLRINTPI
jgi:hypothetical protein